MISPLIQLLPSPHRSENPENKDHCHLFDSTCSLPQGSYGFANKLRINVTQQAAVSIHSDRCFLPLVKSGKCIPLCTFLFFIAAVRIKSGGVKKSCCKRPTPCWCRNEPWRVWIQVWEKKTKQKQVSFTPRSFSLNCQGSICITLNFGACLESALTHVGTDNAARRQCYSLLPFYCIRLSFVVAQYIKK